VLLLICTIPLLLITLQPFMRAEPACAARRAQYLPASKSLPLSFLLFPPWLTQARIRQQNVAFLAFIATADIPARTEFTFDYDPDAQRAHDAQALAEGPRKRQRGSKPKRPPGAMDCVCGAQRCRGWVRTG
jgi:hypothetical protein